MDIEKFTSQKGKTKLRYERHHYVFHRSSSMNQQWRCERYTTCNARILTNHNCSQVINESGDHNHDNNATNKCELSNKLEGLINENQYAKPVHIITKLHSSTSTVMPSDDSIRQKIQYQRRKRKFSEPKSLAEIVLGDIKTIDGASFLLT